MAKLLDSFRELQHKIHLPTSKSKTSDKHFKQLKEYFDIKQCCKLGFPSNASAVDYDPYLKLLAVATKTGDISVYGAPGVEFFAKHSEALEVSRLVFLPEEGRLLSLTSDNKLHKWELNGSETTHWVLEHVSELELGAADDDSQRVTAIGLVGDSVWVGYENGKVRAVTKEFKFAELEFSHESLAKDLTEEARSQIKGWGAVCAISASPASGKQVAVGFISGPIAVVNAEGAIEGVIPSASGLSCFSWQRDGTVMVSGHEDGSLVHWKVASPENMIVKAKENPSTVYGPFACNAVTKLAYRTAKMGAFTVFAGGMARNTHSDRHTVTVLREQDHVCFDFSSPVVDIVVMGVTNPDPDAAQYDDPHTLLVLCQEEMVAVDLYGSNWPFYRMPYLQSLSLGVSRVTLAKYYRGVSEDVFKALSAGTKKGSKLSTREWPISGGKIISEEKAEEEGAEAASPVAHDILITAHENGVVNFWNYTKHQLSHLNTLNTGHIFELETDGANITESESFPPFRAAGNLVNKLQTQDSRLTIQTLDLFEDVLVVGGTAGQVSVWTIGTERAEVELDVLKVNADIVSTKDNYEWEGCSSLKVKEGAIACEAPFKATSLVQVFPPAGISAVAFSKSWGMLAVGTTHGLAVIDTVSNRCASVKSTLPATEDGAAGGAENGVPATPQSRGAQITMSIRQSFRKLKKLRGGKKAEYTVNEEDKENDKKDKKKDKKKEKIDEEDGKAAEAKETEGEEKKDETAEEKKDDAAEEKTEEVKEEEPEDLKKGVEEKKEPETEEKKQDEAAASTSPEEEVQSKEEEVVVEPMPPQKLTAEPCGGLIHTLTFSNTYLTAPATPVNALFAGDNNGKIYAFTLTIPAEKRQEDLKVQLSKELHLRHGAPVVGLVVFGVGKDSPRIGDVAVEGHPHHELLVISEEQVKIFNLPSLKPKSKNRLANAGATTHRVRSYGYGLFHSTAKEATQHALLISDSAGETIVLSVPGLKKQAVHRTLPDKHPAPLIMPCDGTDSPIALHLAASGEVDGYCVAATSCCYLSKATVELAEEMRPKPVEPVVEVPAAEEKKEEEKKEDGEEKQEETAADMDKSVTGVVTADITMDDIKEYVTSTSPVKTAEPIAEEEKRTSTTEAVEEPKKEEVASTPVAEVKAETTAESSEAQAEVAAAGDS